MSPAFDAEVVVMPKPEVADPQGRAIEAALANLKPTDGPPIRAAGVRVGKVFRLRLEAPDREAASHALEALADRVLANPNTEAFVCEIAGAE